MKLPKTLAATFGSIAALAMLPAMAGSAEVETRSLEVSTAGYDLTDAEDAKTVFSRISRAAKRVCGLEGVHQPLRERAIAQECYDQAVERAVTSVNAPAVTLVMNDRLGSS